METYFINYKFVYDQINALDPKYTTKFDLEHSKLFLYANTFSIIKLYDLYHPFKKSNYSIQKNFYSDPYEFIKYSISYIKENQYYKYDILFLYSIVISDVLKQKLSKYLIDLEPIKLDLAYAHLNHYHFNKKNLYKTFSKNYLYSLTDLDYINNIFLKLYKFPKGDRYMRLCLKKFKELSKRNFFLLPLYKMKDFLFYRNRKNKHANFIYKKFKKNEEITLSFGAKTLDSILSEAKDDASLLLEAINQSLYYSNQKPLKEYYKKK